jgi:hypothetical protein
MHLGREDVDELAEPGGTAVIHELEQAGAGEQATTEPQC